MQKKVTAKQALSQLQRQVARLERFAQSAADRGEPADWKLELDILSLKYAIPLVERQMRDNAARHEGGTQPSREQS